jgi:hypothetical protein
MRVMMNFDFTFTHNYRRAARRTEIFFTFIGIVNFDQLVRFVKGIRDFDIAHDFTLSGI